MTRCGIPLIRSLPSLLLNREERQAVTRQDRPHPAMMRLALKDVEEGGSRLGEQSYCCRLCSRELWVSRGNCPLRNNFIMEILDIF
ncbi:hypothetical protein NL676_005519 [Syzygium grande]|nr:hypothetical protein NL676_005519 [Syzygium grande]